MPTYIVLSNLTDHGLSTLKVNPERVLEVNKEIEGMGGKVLGQWAVLGGYDFVTIIEAADNEAMGRISVELGSRGTVRMTTLPAMDVKGFTKRLGAAKPEKKAKKGKKGEEVAPQAPWARTPDKGRGARAAPFSAGPPVRLPGPAS